MPLIKEKQEVDVVVGHQCDVCGKVDLNNFNDFFIDHTFGYDSDFDGQRVTAAICDNCLHRIIKKHVPNAKFETG